MISPQSVLYQRVRSNDRTLRCLRIAPPLSVAHLSEALLSNAVIHQIVVASVGSSGFGDDAPLSNHKSTVVCPPAYALADFAKLLASMHHLPLKALDVSNLALTDAHIPHVVALVDASKTLQRLTLSKNVLSAASARLIGASVARHATLTKLDVSLCGLGNDGLLIFLGAMTPETCRLEALDLSHNLLSEPSTAALSEFILENNSLTSVNVKGNFVHGATVVSVFNPAMQRNKDAKAKRAQRPSSALGFLSTVDVGGAASSSSDKGKGTTSGAVVCPTLDLLSRQLEAEQ